jgi:excisionase family DNA binding protein
MRASAAVQQLRAPVAVEGVTTAPSTEEAIEAVRAFANALEEWPPPPGSREALVQPFLYVAIECLQWAHQERACGQRVGLMTIEQASRVLGIGRTAAYRAASTGELPTLRLGHRVYVPTARLFSMLGLDSKEGP